VGAGAEYMIGHNLSVKGEYIYANLGKFSIVSTATNPGGAAAPASFTANYGSVILNIVRAGLNYKF
jgi:opacity protein-like surface antigen